MTSPRRLHKERQARSVSVPDGEPQPRVPATEASASPETGGGWGAIQVKRAAGEGRSNEAKLDKTQRNSQK